MASAFLLMLLSCGDEPGRVDSLETLTVNVKVPGTLIDNVKPEELVEAKCLIVRGDINCVDLAHIRNFGYAPDEHGNAPVKELLDMSGCNIVDGESEEFGISETDVLSGLVWIKCKDIRLPESIRAIGYSALSYVETRTVRIPDKVESIGIGAFAHSCVSEMDIPSTVKSMGRFVFWDCQQLRRISLPEMKEIPFGAFSGCALEQVHIPEGVEIIGDGAFEGCRMLSELTLPRSLKKIGMSAFVSCESLKSLTVPEGIAEISEYAFGDNFLKSPLKELHYQAKEPCWIYGVTVVAGVEDCVLYVPRSSLFRFEVSGNWGFKDVAGE